MTLLDEMMAATPTLGRRVAEARKARGWSVLSLSSRAKVSTGTVRRVEQDNALVKLASVERILVALELTWPEPRPPPR